MKTESIRKLIVLAAGIVLLAAVNLSIYLREQLLANGAVVLLELAPVDPRSLMQGDYMALRYKLANDAFRGLQADVMGDGHLVVGLDARGIASFKRFADAAPLAAGETLMRYRVRNNEPKFATNAFFFQEGSARRYELARYGEFRVAPNGDMILTGLRGQDLSAL